MKTKTGVFTSLEQATHAVERIQERIPEDAVRIDLLTPGKPAQREEVPRTEDMAPVGAPLGGILGGTMGLCLGVLIPGLGAVTAVGAAAGALLAAGGGVAGWKAGKALDQALGEGLPVDELYVYEDALRQGRSVVIVTLANGEEKRSDEVAGIFEDLDAEGVDAARERWWQGLRESGKLEYDAPTEGASDGHELAFRTGFQAALSPRFRGREFPEARPELETWHGAQAGRDAFRHGYEQGQTHWRRSREQESGLPANARK
jgi:hypothetical protein